MTAETKLIQVPDAIEPYIGFKYLRWHNNRFWSDWGDKPWPINQPLVAECHSKEALHEWRLVGGKPKKRTAYDEDDNEYASDEDKPQVLPPPGMSWSWEECPPHDPVAESCKCGIYAVDNHDGCAAYGPDPGASGFLVWSFGPQKPGSKILIEIAVWGKVIPGDKGVRGQFAYPQKVYGTSVDALAAAEAYGVPLVERDYQKPRKSSKKNPDTFPGSFYQDYRITLDTTDLTTHFTTAADPTSTPHKSDDLRREFFKSIGAILP